MFTTNSIQMFSLFLSLLKTIGVKTNILEWNNMEWKSRKEVKYKRKELMNKKQKFSGKMARNRLYVSISWSEAPGRFWQTQNPARTNNFMKIQQAKVKGH